MSIKKPRDPFHVFKLLAGQHEANTAQFVALTDIIEHQDARIARVEGLLSPAERSDYVPFSRPLVAGIHRYI
jgi:hypothetical protein